MEEADEATSSHDSQSILLAAGRLEAQIAARPDQNNTTSGDIIACSNDNLLAIVDTPSAIKLVHLSAPQRTHLLPIQEKPNLLSFSPRGDALFAAFHTGKLCCLWTRTSQALNEWSVKQTWTNWQGKVLGFQWLGGPRKWSVKELRRKPTRGPQFAAEKSTYEVGAVAVCESGQIVLFHGRVGDDVGVQIQTINIAIPSQEKIAKAAIGLVPDESTALIAYTKRMSSKATIPRSTAEGNALGMFFEGDPDVAALDQQQSSSSQLDDGQDKIIMIEVRIDLAGSPSCFALRPLPPIYLSSYEARGLPTAASLTSIVWFEGIGQAEIETTSTKMNLFASFYQDGATSLRTWEAQREEVEVLSEAFAKLEAAKSRVNDEEREDWVTIATHHEIYPDYIGDQYQVVPSGESLLCSWTHVPPAESLFDIKKPRTEYRMIDCTTLQFVDEKASQAMQTQSNTPALSASGCLAAQIVHGKVRIVETSKQARWSTDGALAYWPALIDARDVSDVLRTAPCDLEAIASAINIDETSFEQVSKMVQLAAQRTEQSGRVLARNSRVLLEIIQCFTMLKEADKEVYWDHSQIWVIVSTLEWLVWLVESMAKQAYLKQATASVSTPAQTSQDSATLPAEGEADLLALMTVALPRRVLIQCIIRAVRFCNWLHRVNQSKEEVKAMMSNANFQEGLKNGSQESKSRLWTIADSLRMAQVQVGEVMLNSAIDLSQTGRVLKAYSDDIKEEGSNGKWWTRLDVGNRSKMAHSLIEGNCIKTALSLFCPANGEAEEEASAVERDVLTKAKLDSKEHHSVCLSCTAKTQLSVAFGKKCVCGSQSWWKV